LTAFPPLTELAADVSARVESDRERIVSLCGRLVEAPSVNPPGDTRAVADVVWRQLTDGGLSPRIRSQDPAMPSVLATLDSGQPGPHLVLNVHLDTMPPGDADAWSVPVLRLTRRQGRLYGLGMGNMKGAIAAMLTAVEYLHQMRGQWSGQITFTAVSDEVVFGENGASYLLRADPALYGDALLCGEGPGYGRLALAEKGVLWASLSATSPGGHASAAGAGTSAAARLAAAVLAVDALSGQASTPPGALAEMTAYGLPEEWSVTANIGTLTAGTFISQIATSGRADVDLRFPPGLALADAEALLREAVSGLGVEVTRLKGWEANWTSPGAPLTQAFQHAHLSLCGEPAHYAVRLPASDASRWRAHHIPALCFGPQPTLSAGADDYAEENDVLRCAALYTLTAISLACNPW
jgi:succinyl-diaminopimelate desuccinylase